MHALIVTPREDHSSRRIGRISIFPGSPSPSIFRAGAPFSIGCGFSSGTERGSRERRALDADTRFELSVDGKEVELEAVLEIEDGIPVGKLETALFPKGLAPGWHRFVGHWYDEGALVLTSDKTIEFVEP